MTQQELIQKRNEAVDTLVAAGWDYDNARFATMTALKKPAVVLSEQPTGKSHPALTELAEMVTGNWQAEPAKTQGSRVNSTNEMQDQ